MEVKVLGTSFNVSAYPGVKRQTTLIEGQVAVNWHRQQVVIRPGQQAAETDEGLRVASVNVMNYVGWKEHRFVYENKLLGEVLEDLERWYDVEVFVMHDEIRNLHLTANLPKYENMDKVLEIIDLPFRSVVTFHYCTQNDTPSVQSVFQTLPARKPRLPKY